VLHDQFGCQKDPRLVVDQLVDLFHTTHTVKTQHLTKSRGRNCGDIELTGYLVNVTGPVSLMLDLRITRDRFESRSDLNLNGHLHYSNDIDRSLMESSTDKIRKYRSDYNKKRSKKRSVSLTVFLYLQEFNLCILQVDTSTSLVPCSPTQINSRVDNILVKDTVL
jgi:hypothetical protein